MVDSGGPTDTSTLSWTVQLFVDDRGAASEAHLAVGHGCPRIGFLWVILLAGFFSAVIQGLRTGEWAWDEGLKNSKWAKGRQLSERCKVSYRLLTGLVIGVVMAWSGHVLWQNWPGGVRGVLYGLGVIVAMLIAAEVFGLAVLLPFYALCPIDVRDTIVLSLSDCLSEARLGYVIRSGPRTRIRAGTALFRWREAPQSWPQEGLPPVGPCTGSGC